MPELYVIEQNVPIEDALAPNKNQIWPLDFLDTLEVGDSFVFDVDFYHLFLAAVHHVNSKFEKRFVISKSKERIWRVA